MMQPVSLKPFVNFKGVDDNNFKGANAIMPQSNMLLEGRNTREDYNSAVQTVTSLQNQFTAPKGVGVNFDTMA